MGKHQCAANNDGFHTWDYPSDRHGRDATACITVPAASRAILSGQVSYEALAWWVHGRLPRWSHVEFFATPEHSDEVCFNIDWHEQPMKTMTPWRGGPCSLLARMPPAVERSALAQSLVNCSLLNDKI
ncbi:hypothetical protein [Ottowia sp.]|uniref:hypothetical protein n=1 Tax=Ottowia sp. TaxID=1898956 RepID=UPI0025DB5D61|nr:hypothetical protein [Ottowia sp.]MBK6613044.1 hypothetical protein [Ottowia sp.]MBK6747844.1 hypothetical protein [Ottowia sp.]